MVKMVLENQQVLHPVPKIDFHSDFTWRHSDRLTCRQERYVDVRWCPGRVHEDGSAMRLLCVPAGVRLCRAPQRKKGLAEKPVLNQDLHCDRGAAPIEEGG
ncbi:hypothetical protein TNCV_2039381 [Trichonephila clavipes]|nr:hypothetical protein TNCV_2039381 [Trichonephila clavipes]